eukprot:12263951-Alexandrium_andersonii.AAC.1
MDAAPVDLPHALQDGPFGRRLPHFSGEVGRLAELPDHLPGSTEKWYLPLRPRGDPVSRDYDVGSSKCTQE